MASSSLPVYDVVLSSSSKDADDFSSLLCKSLTSKGIRVLRSEDGQEVEGDTTTTSQELAIQESTRFAIVILSRNYASSPRLLEELSQILERKRVSGISVSPVFYDVKPSDVEQQTGDFGESFNKNVLVFKEDPEKVLRWRIALREVAKLIGWSSEHRNQTKLIKEIVNFVAVRREQPSSLSSSLQNIQQWCLAGCNLIFLRLSRNKFAELPREILQLPHLRSLDLSDCVPLISNIKNIQQLCLDGWMLEIISENISLLGQLSNLKILSLSQYEFEELPRDILQLPHLRSLHLSDCGPLISNIKNIQQLCLDGWMLENISENISLLGQLSNLKILSLSQYKFAELPREILQLPRLQSLHLSDCDPLIINIKADISNTEIGVDVNALDDREGTTDATSSADWNFLLIALVLEICSACFDQASSPRKPHYALIGMLLAIAAVLACTWELIHKGSLVLKRWQQLGCFYYLHPSNTFFDVPDSYGLVSTISQFVFSTVQYIYFSHHVDSPIKLSLLPAIFLMCLAGSRLNRNQRPSSLTNGRVMSTDTTLE